MSARLFIEGYEADTLGDIDVEFTFSIADIKDIDRRNTSFSKTLTLPSTARNQQLFGNIFDISVANDIDINQPNILINFNPAKQAKGQIFLDGVNIFDGVLRMSKINSIQGEVTYDVNLFGRLRDILHVLGDKTLAELNFDEYNHTFNKTNIEGSWNRTEWVEGAQNYVYPLVDYGYKLQGEIYPINNFKPSLFVTEILKRIFAEAQFVLKADIFESFFFRRLLLMTAEKTITKEVTSLLDQSTLLKIEEIESSTFYLDLLSFQNVENLGFTISATGDTFTWNKDQNLASGLTLNFKISLESLVADTNNSYTINVLRNDALILTDVRDFETKAIGQINNWDVSISGAINLQKDDVFKVEIVADAINMGASGIQTKIIIQPGGSLKIGNTVPVAVEIEEGDEMQISFTLPKSMKQRDFLKSIITMYNLYIIPDRLNPSAIEIIPYDEFYLLTKDQAIDWTDKLDYSQDIGITPLSELTAKEYKLTFDTDTDFFSQAYKTKFNAEYGEKSEIIDNDFILDTKTVKVVFAPPVMREELAGQIMVHLYKLENNVKQPDNFKPRLVYWKPNIECPSWNIEFKAGVDEYTIYPYAGHLDDPKTPVVDHLFGTPEEVLFSIGEYPEDNLYERYYKGLIDSIGDRNSRLLDGYFYLTPTDISNLDFRRIIKVGNHFYQLQKVDKYNPIQNGLAHVSLFKILSDIASVDFDFILLENESFMLQENDVSRFYI